ncbi:MAG TPA: hypothetical protein VFS00_30075, partial [Polyangiaceae bacterium]|nr:hypothetical protein [Polyangiaceae bacterium]
VERDRAVATADVVIGTCAPRYRYYRSSWGDDSYDDGYACAAGRAPGGGGGPGAFGRLGLVGLAAAARRRARTARA